MQSRSYKLCEILRKTLIDMNTSIVYKAVVGVDTKKKLNVSALESCII